MISATSITDLPLSVALPILRANAHLFGLSPVTASALDMAIAVLEHVADFEPCLASARTAYEAMIDNGIDPDLAKLITLTALLANGVSLPGLEDEAMQACGDVLCVSATVEAA